MSEDKQPSKAEEIELHPRYPQLRVLSKTNRFITYTWTDANDLSAKRDLRALGIQTHVHSGKDIKIRGVDLSKEKK